MPTVHGYTFLPLPFDWDDWLPLLSSRIGKSAEAIQRDGLTVEDFPPGTVYIDFNHGKAQFDFAFMLVQLEQNRCCLFTCYNGIYVLPCSTIDRAYWQATPDSPKMNILKDFEYQSLRQEQQKTKSREHKEIRDGQKWQEAKAVQQARQRSARKKAREG
jgi:hypothetical protein